MSSEVPPLAESAGDAPAAGMEPRSPAVKLLIVDDLPENLLALRGLLEASGLGLDVHEAGSGQEALRQCLRYRFALILLDVQMPGMDGMEVAAMLRSNPKTRSTPIIFVTAGLNSEQHSFKGYESGAIDYLIKPVNGFVLLSKVRIFLEMFQQRLQIEASAQHLEQQVRERTAELARLNAGLEQEVQQRSQELQLAQARLMQERHHAALGRMVAGMAHNIGTPLGNVRLAASTLQHNVDALLNALEHRALSRTAMNELLAGCGEALRLIDGGCMQIVNLQQQLRDIVAGVESYVSAAYSLRNLAAHVLAGHAQELAERRVSVSNDVPGDLWPHGPSEALAQVLKALVRNALDHAFEPGMPGAALKISARREGDDLQLDVIDNGCGVPAELMGRICDPFFTTRMGLVHYGLGLNLVQSLTRSVMHGQLQLLSPEQGGLLVRLVLPYGPGAD
ncbi:response regulator [Roseateles sp.]|jgi:C4-dicarboxylate-specific signal transduction histidine kinase|uniref:response regulator n=1 Tax=Roseateles sp. TaxID=1971397 RepID=UPI00391C618A